MQFTGVLGSCQEVSESILPYRIDIVRHDHSICQATDLQKGGRASAKADQRPLSCASENH